MNIEERISESKKRPELVAAFISQFADSLENPELRAPGTDDLAKKQARLVRALGTYIRLNTNVDLWINPSQRSRVIGFVNDYLEGKFGTLETRESYGKFIDLVKALPKK
jgi:hypothetical protein